MKGIDIRIGEIASPLGRVRDLRVGIGRVGSGTWDEPAGPTPCPSPTALRDWDRRLLARYRPFYMPLCDLCCLCTYGKCDLSGGKTRRLRDHHGRPAVADRAARGLHRGRDPCEPRPRTPRVPDRTERTDLSARHGRALGRSPHADRGARLRPAPRDARRPRGRARLLSTGSSSTSSAATHTGQEGDPIDFESKVFHAGMIDHVALEVADTAQVSAFDFPKADPAGRARRARARVDRRREARGPRGRAQRPAGGRDPRLPRVPTGSRARSR